jgi:hypothetical protein
MKRKLALLIIAGIAIALVILTIPMARFLWDLAVYLIAGAIVLILLVGGGALAGILIKGLLVASVDSMSTTNGDEPLGSWHIVFALLIAITTGTLYLVCMPLILDMNTWVRLIAMVTFQWSGTPGLEMVFWVLWTVVTTFIAYLRTPYLVGKLESSYERA